MKQTGCCLALLFSIALLHSCVPAKKLEDVQNMNNSLLLQNKKMKEQDSVLLEQVRSLTEELNARQKQLSLLTSDTAYYGERYRKIETLNNQLNELYEKLIDQNKQLLSNASTDKIALSDSLHNQQIRLMQKEMQLTQLQSDLEEREQKLNDMQHLLALKDSTTNALKQKISDALRGFESSDLTVEERNGKIYVSMAEKLLFKSGSTAVDPKGVDALQKLAEVLKKNPDIAVDVEGHTDNVPLNGTGFMKDNWDLSVLRATSITRILTQAGVNPLQITASGHGEFMPVADNSTTEGKAQNRRTEIILSPKLDELFKLLEQQ